MPKWIIVCALLLMSVGGVYAQDAPTVDVSPALIAQLEEIEAFVAEARGLDVLEPLNRVFPTRVDVQTYLQESIETQLTEELIAESEAFYQAFGFVEPGVDIVDVYLELIEDQIGGYYDPEDKSLNTILMSGGELGDSLPLLEQIIYAHEFVHALQDQHYSLESLGYDDEAIDDIETDRFLAVQALVEGDATYMMNLYTEDAVSRNPLAALGILGAVVGSGSATIPEGTPEILTEELFFPYNNGLTFVTALVSDGGYEAVDAAFNNLPVSTEQILHPQKYLTGEQPISVTVGDPVASLGSDWSEALEETLGEFYLRAYLGQHLEREVANAAAAGWGGDRYRIYRQDGTGDLAWLLNLVWDNEGEAEEFATLFPEFADVRYGTVAVDGCWESADEALCLFADGDTTVLAAAPTLAQAASMLRPS